MAANSEQYSGINAGEKLVQQKKDGNPEMRIKEPHPNNERKDIETLYHRTFLFKHTNK